nr:MAG TPA: hypothetical protein [Caudoviricetes sp.]
MIVFCISISLCVIYYGKFIFSIYIDIMKVFLL